MRKDSKLKKENNSDKSTTKKVCFNATVASFFARRSYLIVPISRSARLSLGRGEVHWKYSKMLKLMRKH